MYGDGNLKEPDLVICGPGLAIYGDGNFEDPGPAIPKSPDANALIVLLAFFMIAIVSLIFSLLHTGIATHSSPSYQLQMVSRRVLHQ